MRAKFLAAPRELVQPLRERLAAVGRATVRGLALLVAPLGLPVFWIIAMLASGGVCLVTGVAMLAGAAWAFIAAAATLFALAALALRGLALISDQNG